MMRLQYVWVEKFRCLNNIGFNFTDKYRFSMENEVLSYEDHSDKYIEGLVDKNMDVSVLVGNNGVGKTTLLQLIKSICCGYKDDGCKNVVIVFENIGAKSAKRFSVYADKKVNLSKDLDEITEQVNDLSKRLEGDTLYVYYSPFIQNVNDNRMPIDQQGAKDLSTGFLLRKKEWEVQSKGIKFPIQEYLTDEYQKQITFFSKSKDLIKDFTFEYPNDAKVLLINNEALIPDDMWDDGEDLYKSQIIRAIKRVGKIKNNIKGQKSFITAIAQKMLLNFLVFFVYPAMQQYKVKLDSLDGTYSLKSIKKFLSNIANDDNSVFREKASASVAFLKYLENDARWGTGSFQETPWKISLEKEPENDCLLGDLEEFFNHYIDTVCGNPYLFFSWPLSSGEMTVLSMMSRFYDLREDVKTHNIECIRILLDEAEASLHPEWQRRFLNIFQNAVREMFPGKHIQIIAATHSPIILSDVPRQNVVLLNPPDDRTARFSETFGANIYSLYHDDFFLDKYCGEFAREKIEEVIDSVYKKSGKKRANKPAKDKTNKSIAYKEAKKRVNLIGDKFIKNELQRMIDKIDRKEHREDVSN